MYSRYIFFRPRFFSRSHGDPHIVIHETLLFQELAWVVRPSCESCECEGCSALRGLEATVESYEGTEMDKNIEVRCFLNTNSHGIESVWHSSAPYTGLDTKCCQLYMHINFWWYSNYSLCFAAGVLSENGILKFKPHGQVCQWWYTSACFMPYLLHAKRIACLSSLISSYHD